jgi:hypothetical protein
MNLNTLDKETRKSTYTLKDINHDIILYTGSFRQCYLKRDILAKHENIGNFIIEVV